MIKDFLNEIFIKPFQEHFIAFLLLIGVFFIIIGGGFSIKLDSLTYVGFGESILKIGSAALGGGIFAVIMKSAQFTKVFQKNIMDVLYSPSNIKEKSYLKEKWRFLTNEMLKNVLPIAHCDATEHIEKIFFNAELDYHFENHEICYEITVKDDKVVVKNITNTTIVLSPNIEEPLFEQKFWSVEESKLCKLFLDGENINKEELFTIDSKDSTLKTLSFPFKDYGIIKKENEDTRVSFERILEYSQTLSDDPVLISTINRYAKGFVVRAKITDGYKLVFNNFGYNGSENLSYIQDDGDSFERWQLAKPGKLLLPGYGYVITIIKIK